MLHHSNGEGLWGDWCANMSDCERTAVSVLPSWQENMPTLNGNQSLLNPFAPAHLGWRCSERECFQRCQVNSSRSTFCPDFSTPQGYVIVPLQSLWSVYTSTTEKQQATQTRRCSSGTGVSWDSGGCSHSPTPVTHFTSTVGLRSSSVFLGL